MSLTLTDLYPDPIVVPRPLPRRLYVDDSRNCPGGWVPCRTPEDFRYLVSTYVWDDISFDYDLSDVGSEETGLDLLVWMFAQGYRPKYKPTVHTWLRRPGRLMKEYIDQHWAT